MHAIFYIPVFMLSDGDFYAYDYYDYYYDYDYELFYLYELTLSASSWMMIFAGGMLTAAIISSVIVIFNPRWPAMLGLGIIVR